MSVPINIDRAYILHYYDRNEEALRSVNLALEMNPKYAPGYFWLGRIYTSQGRYADAEVALQKIGALRKWTPAMGRSPCAERPDFLERGLAHPPTLRRVDAA